MNTKCKTKQCGEKPSKDETQQLLLWLLNTTIKAQNPDPKELSRPHYCFFVTIFLSNFSTLTTRVLELTSKSLLTHLWSWKTSITLPISRSAQSKLFQVQWSYHWNCSASSKLLGPSIQEPQTAFKQQQRQCATFSETVGEIWLPGNEKKKRRKRGRQRYVAQMIIQFN